MKDETIVGRMLGSLSWLPRSLAARALVWASIAALGLGTSDMASSAPVAGTDVTYTLDANFDQGTLLSVNHDSPNNDQLRLSKPASPFPFVNIAASARGTIIRIDVVTGAVLGEYLTSPDGMGRNPSRTTVDQLGNAWVANRDEFGESPPGSGEPRGSIARVGLISGGTRADSDGTPNPAGQYLSPPFQYNTCVDRDNDGLIKTSSSLGNILPWTNAGGVDTHGGVATAEDECILNYTRVTGTGTRTLAIDASNDVWVGGFNNHAHEKVDGVTGAPVPGTAFDLGCGGYGGLIDGNGILWSASQAAAGGSLLRYDPGASSGECLSFRGNYGLGIDPNTGHIWQSTFAFSDDVYELDAAGNVLNVYPQGLGAAQGVAVDGNSHVWVAQLFGAVVAHFAPDPLNPGQHVLVGYVPGFVGSTGVAVDANGKIWVAEIDDRASRIDPSAGPIGGGGHPVGAIDLSVPLGPGAGPYNYSDMTGFVVIGSTSPQGTWTVTQDSGAAGTAWGKVTWNTEPQGSEPAGTTITAAARAADTEAGLSSEVFVPISNGVPFALSGRFIEVQATLQTSNIDVSPILSDLTIRVRNEPPDCSNAAADPDTLWAPNHLLTNISVVGATDPDPEDVVTITATAVTQDEKVLSKAIGSSNTSPDASLSPLAVRAERNGNPKTPGNGRMYHISFTADDGNGGTCNGTVNVCVPHDQRPGATCIDDGPLHNSIP